MDAIDWIIVAILGTGFLTGLRKGLFRQLASLVGLIGGLFVARALFVRMGERMADVVGTSVPFAQVLSFFLIWLLIPVALSIVASLLTKMAEATHLGFVNRLLGACLGFIKFALFTSLAIHLIEFADSENSLIQKATKQQSLLYYPIANFSDTFYPIIKKTTQELIETTDL